MLCMRCFVVTACALCGACVVQAGSVVRLGGRGADRMAGGG